MDAGSHSPSEATSDAALLEAMARIQSQAAFHELFRRYAPKLKAHFLRAGAGAALAEDLVQDVLLNVWHHAESYRPEVASVPTWIFRIARNRYIDVVRRQRYVTLEPSMLDEPALGASGPEHDFSQQQLGARVQQAMGSLSKEQAEVIRGAYFAHESASEIATRLKIPTGTVKSRLRAALAHMQKSLFGSARGEGEEP
jgi:RNA polymerase sigma factor (sigma-70 family)